MAPLRGASRSPPAVPLEYVEEHAAGLVCLSGCAPGGCTTSRRCAVCSPPSGATGCGSSFSGHSSATTARATGAWRTWRRQLGVPCVATGNVHAHARARAPLQDAFVALRHHTGLDASEPMRRGNFAHVLASPAAMAARFEDHPAAVAESRALAERLTFDLRVDLGYRYPGSEDPAADRQLAELCAARFDDRYPPGDRCRDEARGRLEEELRVIASLRLAGFFLLHHELLELAREVAAEVRGPDTARALLPPGRGRGSSVSSIVCYLTGLSHIDPVRNELFLGRFLNEELTALPDIDLDFPRDVREHLIPRVHARYGRERSALVAAFPTFKSRGAIRELGKVLGLPPGELERVARGAEPYAVRGVAHDVAVGLGLDISGPRPDPLARDPEAPAPFAQSTTEWLEMARRWMTEEEWRKAASGEDPSAAERWAGDGPPPGPVPPLPTVRDERRYAGLPGRWGWLARLCDEAYGLPRHLSQHSGGMIVSTRPLIDCCPRRRRSPCPTCTAGGPPSPPAGPGSSRSAGGSRRSSRPSAARDAAAGRRPRRTAAPATPSGRAGRRSGARRAPRAAAAPGRRRAVARPALGGRRVLPAGGLAPLLLGHPAARHLEPLGGRLRERGWSLRIARQRVGPRAGDVEPQADRDVVRRAADRERLGPAGDPLELPRRQAEHLAELADRPARLERRETRRRAPSARARSARARAGSAARGRRAGSRGRCPAARSAPR